MYKMIRFFNQNRKQIFRIILIIVLMLVLLRMINSMVTNQAVETSKEETERKTVINETKELVSEKSLVSGQKISPTKIKDVKVINNFIDYCNKKEFNLAYDLLTEECKQLMFPTIQDFYNIYYRNIFNGESKKYTIENWTGDTYSVKFVGDILSTGKIEGNGELQDYITITNDKNNENKLNINSYIGRTIPNKITDLYNIETKVLSIDKYMDYEIYEISVKNNSKNDILLDAGDTNKSIYLLDRNDSKFYFYNTEVTKNDMMVKSQNTNRIKIKFNNVFTSDRKIEKLVFSKVVMNYKEYFNYTNKEKYDFYQYGVEI